MRRAAMTLQLCPMPVTVFSLRGIPSNPRERIEASVCRWWQAREWPT